MKGLKEPVGKKLFQKALNHDVCMVPSHKTIDKIIDENGKDYRFEVASHPIEELRDRTCDNVCVGVI